MRHRNSKARLTKTQGQRKAILMNLAKAVFTHKRITTTLGKAKAVQPLIERIISYGKKEGLHAYRLVESELHDQRLVKKVVETIVPHYKDRNGGYSRIVKSEFRLGDNAPMAILELVGDYSLKEVKPVEEAPAEEKKPVAKKVVKKVVVGKTEKE